MEGIEKKLCTLIPRLATPSTHCDDSDEIGELCDVSRPSTCKMSTKCDEEGDKADHLSPPMNSIHMCIGQKWNKFRALYCAVLYKVVQI